MQNASSSGDVRTAPPPALRQAGAGLQHIQPGQRADAQAARASDVPQHRRRPRLSQTSRSRAAAASAAWLMRLSRSAKLGVHEARAVGHGLAHRQLRMRPQLLDGNGRRLDHVAQLLVVPDLQRGHAVALRQVQRQAGHHPAAVVPQRPLRIQLPIEARRRSTPPSSSRAAGALGDEGAGRVGLPAPGPGRSAARPQGAPSSAAAASRALDKRGGDRGQVPRRPRGPVDRRPRARARSGTPRNAARRAAKRRGLGQQPGPAVLPAGDGGRVQQRPTQPRRQQPRARRGQPCLFDRRQQGVRRVRRRGCG